MALTLDFISREFDRINNNHFGGQLLKPRFEITHVKSYLGQYHWRYSYDERIFWDSVIRISDMFDRSDADIINTIAHEMIHLYIRQNKIKDTRAHHGRVFYSVADRLNREGGFHIARTDSVDGCGLRNKTEEKTYYVACFFSDRTRQPFRFVMHKNYVNKFIKRFENYPSHYKNVFVFTSTDDKTYAHYPACRSSVRGWNITKQEFDRLRETENIIHQFQTLGIRHDAA